MEISGLIQAPAAFSLRRANFNEWREDWMGPDSWSRSRHHHQYIPEEK
jgi:hypothetical protein